MDEFHRMTFPSNYSQPKYIEEDEDAESTDITTRDVKLRITTRKTSKNVAQCKLYSRILSNLADLEKQDNKEKDLKSQKKALAKSAIKNKK